MTLNLYDDIFTVQPVPKSGALNRLRGRISKEAAFVEIRNLLATTSFELISGEDVAAILVQAKLTVSEVGSELLGIYEEAAWVLARDQRLDASDRDKLTALHRAFDLAESDAAEARTRVAQRVFQLAMRDALQDGVFDAGEQQRTKDCAEALGLPEDSRNAVYLEAAKAALESAFQAAVADRRYTGDEERTVQEFARVLGITIKHDEETEKRLERARMLARAEAGDLPTTEVPILLQRGEVCHFQCTKATHKELRTVTKRVNYSGPVASVKITKHLRWRVGSVAVQRVTQDILTDIDVVALYITNKRVLLQGMRKNTALPFSKIMQFTVYQDGLQIDKHTGKDLFIVGDADWELAGICLDAGTKGVGLS